MVKHWALFAMMVLFVFTGCSNRQLITYNDVERTNSVEIQMTTGEKVEGTILKAEPLELILLSKDKKKINIPKSTIREITRRKPVYDDFGKGIAEEEIEQVKGSKNAKIYGIGGGMISLAASFFVGSTVSHNMDNGAAVLAGTTVGGTALGTYFFVKAGQAKDREEAIEFINFKRRQKTVQTQKSNQDATDELMQKIEEEKVEQEKLRKEREALLKKLKSE